MSKNKKKNRRPRRSYTPTVTVLDEKMRAVSEPSNRRTSASDAPSLAAAFKAIVQSLPGSAASRPGAGAAMEIDGDPHARRSTIAPGDCLVAYSQDN